MKSIINLCLVASVVVLLVAAEPHPKFMVADGEYEFDPLNPTFCEPFVYGNYSYCYNDESTPDTCCAYLNMTDTYKQEVVFTGTACFDKSLLNNDGHEFTYTYQDTAYTTYGYCSESIFMLITGGLTLLSSIFAVY